MLQQLRRVAATRAMGCVVASSPCARRASTAAAAAVATRATPTVAALAHARHHTTAPHEYCPSAPRRRYSNSAHMQPLTCSSPAAVELYDEALGQYVSLSANPVVTLERALALEPNFLAAHTLIAWLYILGTGVIRTSENLDRPLSAALKLVRSGAGSPRERALVFAASAWISGRIRLSAAILEAQLLRSPTDLLIVRLLHDTYYVLGDARNLRDSVGRVLQSWEPTMPGFGKLLGMAAFGYEENAEYDRAENLAMQALGMDSGDVWAMHAALHCYEMNARLNEGSRLLRETRDMWESAALLDHHIHWHWCLLSLESGDYASALSRYDDHMSVGRHPVFNAVDATSLLWRMELAHSPLCPPLERTHAAAETARRRDSATAAAAVVAAASWSGGSSSSSAEAGTFGSSHSSSSSSSPGGGVWDAFFSRDERRAGATASSPTSPSTLRDGGDHVRIHESSGGGGGLFSSVFKGWLGGSSSDGYSSENSGGSSSSISARDARSRAAFASPSTPLSASHLAAMESLAHASAPSGVNHAPIPSSLGSHSGRVSHTPAPTSSSLRGVVSPLGGEVPSASASSSTTARDQRNATSSPPSIAFPASTDAADEPPPVTRWTEVARRFSPFVSHHVTAFNDVHIAMAYAAAGEDSACDAHIDSMAAFAEQGHGRTPPLAAWDSLSQQLFDSSTARSSVAAVQSDLEHSAADMGSAAAAAAAAASTATGEFEAAASVEFRDIPWALCTFSQTEATSSSGGNGNQLPTRPSSASGSHASTPTTSALFSGLTSTLDTQYVTRTVALSMARGMRAFWRRDYETATALLAATRPHWYTIGGSNAQRDVFDLTLIHAALRCGRARFARALLSERTTARFASPQSWYLLSSCAQLMGDQAKAVDARNRAFVLGLGIDKGASGSDE